MDQATELLTARELAKRLRVSPETVRDWSRRGCIPTLRLSRKAIRYNLGAVLSTLSTTPAKGVSRAR
ncbi:MAG: helix-turn-helix domain-containing protein [Phycisphaerales bacterium]|nr:helix-turn-helix domain-containing protein [Phycisphaerales bacterium]